MAMTGFLAEGARTNLCLQSQTFGTTWSVGSTAVSADQYAAPDGTTTVDKITASAANLSHFIYQSLTTSAGVVTFSAYLKYVNNRWACLSVYDGVTTFVASFDLLNGATGAKTASTTSTIEATSVAGIYRCSMTVTSAGSVSSQAYIGLQNTDTATREVWNAAGTEALGAWGAQLEAAAFASTYIPTTTVAVARNADVLSYQLTGNISATVGAAYIEFRKPTVISAANGTGRLLYPGTYLMWTPSATLDTYDNTTIVGTANGPTLDAVSKGATAWSATQTICLNGGAVASGAFDGSKNFAGTLEIASTSGADQPYFPVKNARIWTSALTDAQLVTITTP